MSAAVAALLLLTACASDLNRATAHNKPGEVAQLLAQGADVNKPDRAGVTPFAIASPILVDADGDGHWKRGDADLSVR